MAKNQNTYAKRRREMDKKRKAEEKRARRRRRKEEANQAAETSEADRAATENIDGPAKDANGHPAARGVDRPANDA